jgi:hypothetical protein
MNMYEVSVTVQSAVDQMIEQLKTDLGSDFSMRPGAASDISSLIFKEVCVFISNKQRDIEVENLLKEKL